MSITAIEHELLNLPVEQRLRMIDVLWNSLAEPETRTRESKWANESERRIDAFEAGTLTARDASAVFADLNQGRAE